MFGTRRYATTDDSRNNVSSRSSRMGEGWHNNHHYYQRSARQGFFWWEIDIDVLRAQASVVLGLVWDLRAPPERVVSGGSTCRRRRAPGIWLQVDGRDHDEGPWARLIGSRWTLSHPRRGRTHAWRGCILSAPDAGPKPLGDGLGIQRRRRDSNPWYPCGYAGFQNRCLRPLGHSSKYIESIAVSLPPPPIAKSPGRGSVDHLLTISNGSPYDTCRLSSAAMTARFASSSECA